MEEEKTTVNLYSVIGQLYVSLLVSNGKNDALREEIDKGLSVNKKLEEELGSKENVDKVMDAIVK